MPSEVGGSELGPDQGGVREQDHVQMIGERHGITPRLIKRGLRWVVKDIEDRDLPDTAVPGSQPSKASRPGLILPLDRVVTKGKEGAKRLI